MADARKTISKSSAASRVKKIAKNNPSYQEIREILNRARQEKGHASDRAAAIMGGAMIEDALRVAIKRTFDKKFPEELLPDLFEPEKKGPLSTLGYRILVGYALGVFGPITYSDLKKINVVRNAFAHSAEEISFEMPDLKSLCSEFQLIRESKLPPPQDARDAYIRTVSLMVSNWRIVIRGTNLITWTPVALP
jgi:DNA-binding MltR family transcriptional regulator